MNLQKIKSNFTQILIGVIGILIIVSWIFWIVPDIKNDASVFEEVKEQLGQNSYVEFIGGDLSPPENSKDIIEYKIVNVNRGILEIESRYTSYQITGEKTYENTHTYFVDQKTRKHVGDEGYYFKFPFNVQKQNYLLLDPSIEVPATFVFEEAKLIDDLEVYVFSCKTFGDDLSSGYPEFAPTKIYADQTCKTSVEPITGKTVQFENTWDIYAIQDGVHLPVELGGTQTTEFTDQILLQSAKETKNLFSVFDFVIPTFMVLILSASLSTSVYIKKSKEKEKKSRETKEKLIVAQQRIEMDKIAKKQKEEFISMITHELKTPLTPILGFCQALLDYDIPGQLTTKQIDALEIISKNAVRLQSIIGDLLDSHRLDFGKIKFNFSEVDVSELTKSVIENFKKEIESKNIQVNVDSQPIVIATDRQRVEQVLTNIIINSLEFVQRDTGKISVSVKKTNDHVLFTVTDNGIGIPPSEIENIFNSFSQIETSLTRKHGGAGLGLAICRALVTKLGGKIWVESELGKGSSFYFTIAIKPIQSEKE
jgi:signal transduction histidine kinase